MAMEEIRMLIMFLLVVSDRHVPHDCNVCTYVDHVLTGHCMDRHDFHVLFFVLSERRVRPRKRKSV